MKEFIIESPEKIPPESKDEFFKKNNCSDFYFALAKNEEGNEKKHVVYWDFNAKAWRFIGGMGKKTLIEYYIEK